MPRIVVRKTKRLTFTADGQRLQMFDPSDVDRFLSDFEIYIPSENTGEVFIGDETVDDTWIPRFQESYYQYNSGTGKMLGAQSQGEFDMSEFYVYGLNTDDEVIIEYMGRKTLA